MRLLYSSSTVKPALVTTCLQQAHFLFLLKMVSHYVLKEPVHKDHVLCFPWAVAIDRFDCINQILDQ